MRELQAELNEVNSRAAMTEQVLLRSAAAEAAEVGADVEGVTENVKLCELLPRSSRQQAQSCCMIHVHLLLLFSPLRYVWKACRL